MTGAGIAVTLDAAGVTLDGTTLLAPTSAAVPAGGTLVVDAACGPEYRTVTGRRDLPPYAAAGTRRAWLIAPGAPAVRVTLPG